MPGAFDKIAESQVQSLMRRSADTLTKQMDGAAEKVMKETAAGSLGRDVFVRSASKASKDAVSDDLMQRIVQPDIIRQINIDGVTPKLSDLTKLVHDPALPVTKGEARTFTLALQHNAEREQLALKTLTSDERTTYHSLHKMMNERPDGRLSLQNLLLDGKLTVASTQDPSRNLIGALHDLSKQDLAPGIDRHTLLAQVHDELSDPISISQEHKGTCAATAAGQVQFAMQAPTDYVDLVAGLASPEGKAKLPGGMTVERKPDWRAGNDRIERGNLIPGRPYNQGRSISSQLIEPSFMQVGMGKSVYYSNTLDTGMKMANKAVQATGGGLSAEQSARLMNQLFPNRTYTVVHSSKQELADSFKEVSKKEFAGPRTSMKKMDMFKVLMGASPETPVPVGVNYQLDGGHELLVTQLKQRPILDAAGKKTDQTEPWVQYINPWGRLEEQRADAFLSVLDDMEVPDTVAGVMVN